MRAKALTRPINGRERLLRSDGTIPGGRRLAAIVAIAAGRMVAFTKIPEQYLAPARYGLAIADQRVDLLPLDAGLSRPCFAPVDESQQVHHIGDAVGHPGVGRQAVAPGAPGLL